MPLDGACLPHSAIDLNCILYIPEVTYWYNEKVNNDFKRMAIPGGDDVKIGVVKSLLTLFTLCQ